jgi:DNA-directed RNA polymerase specialized sigma24 family protein
VIDSTARFQTTSWSLVAAAVEPTPDSQEALTTLCRRYWRPVYAFIRRNGSNQDEAQDLTQSFFAILLEKKYLGEAKEQRGRFRSFLLTAVKHFLANQWDLNHALKRGGGQVILSMESAEAEAWHSPLAVDHSTPEHIFELRWALSVLEQVMVKMRAELEASGRAKHFDRLSAFLHGDANKVHYEELAEEFGTSAGALRVSVHRMRHRYRELLRAEIAETVCGPDVDDEIRFLLKTLSA